jgi:hypothetical protein
MPACSAGVPKKMPETWLSVNLNTIPPQIDPARQHPPVAVFQERVP